MKLKKKLSLLKKKIKNKKSDILRQWQGKHVSIMFGYINMDMK